MAETPRHRGKLRLLKELSLRQLLRRIHKSKGREMATRERHMQRWQLQQCPRW